jgi:hypothetical protein
MQHCPSNCHSHTIQRFEGTYGGPFSALDHEYPSFLELTLTATDASGLVTGEGDGPAGSGDGSAHVPVQPSRASARRWRDGTGGTFHSHGNRRIGRFDQRTIAAGTEREVLLRELVRWWCTVAHDRGSSGREYVYGDIPEG